MKQDQPSVLRAGLLVGTALLSFWPLAASAQTAASAAADKSTDKSDLQKDDAVVLSPFVVTTEKDRGYAAANSISGSRVNTAIKDIPIPIHVITSEFIDDIRATDLRQSLTYVAGITLHSQNDLENAGQTFPGGVYGPRRRQQSRRRNFKSQPSSNEGSWLRHDQHAAGWIPARQWN